MIASRTLSFPALLLVLCSLPVAAQAPPAVDRTVAAWVDAHESEANSFLERIVNINSGTHNLEGVRSVAHIMEDELKALGFQVEFKPMDRAPDNVGRAGVLIATHPCSKGEGKCGKRILLIGHMDTVFELTSPFQKYSVNGDIATGPGVNDMKGGLVDMLYALKALQAAGVLDQIEVRVVLSGDEEAHGEPASISRRDMREAAKQSDVALEFEGTPRSNGVFYGSVSRRSSITWRVHSTGETGHSSGIFSEHMGYGAIYELARIIDEFRTKLPEPNLTFNVGMVAGGTQITVDDAGNNSTASGKDNIVAPTAYASGDIRTISNEQTERVEQKMRAIVGEHLAKTGATIEFGEGYPAMAPTEENRALLKLLNRANKELGFGEMPELDPMKRGAGDIAFVADLVPGLAGVGATGEGAHAPGETVDLKAQAINTKRDAVLMWELSQLDEKKSLVEAVK
ncbi:M20/M25/M40 family metallo-hydrolase [Occallatibacter riparius]|uniref:M20/M25/M40 family metallo-hydrolase n=1 Tax=Occallatibacter riparius TaxID=1002689 RepID=A0A9J7BIY3_9BACT|nr:M20/M25/M40 family metallo-hydrolase [Occallatibacter riparius]UWZ82467.1 M20/M25/M40 family metallo-hydrolase [Occallatibacter riparius]